ncbi:unnamed protein product [Calicophoron daubneyi]|uniref:BAR domain-containing protein n=1 Tax=Calicophoron daubneyi TaxID=300641 RepID=A0AAV2TIZ3_CALDB
MSFGTFINRTVQKTEEALRTSEKTPIDPELVNLMGQSEMRKRWAKQLIQLTENMIRPNPAIRLEDSILKGLERTKERTSASEQLGESMCLIGNEAGSSTPVGQSLNQFGNVETTMGRAQDVMIKEIDQKYIGWLRGYVESSCKQAEKEREKLEGKRLDLDRAKTKLRHAKDGDPKKQSYEMAVNEEQRLFDEQCKTAKQAQEKSISEFEKHVDALRAMIEIQYNYHKQCAEALKAAIS